MKLGGILVGLLSAVVLAAETLVWDDPNPPGTVSGYALAVSASDGTVAKSLSVTTNQLAMAVLTSRLNPGVYTLSARAVGTNGLMSLPSTNFVFTVPVLPPINFRTILP